MPFLTDCNTLYPGSRKNALEHLECANLNGFNSISTGCQIIIGDGVRGTDEVEVPVVNGEYCKLPDWTCYHGRAEYFISLSHFKGHETTGFMVPEEYRYGMRKPCRKDAAACQRAGHP